MIGRRELLLSAGAAMLGPVAAPAFARAPGAPRRPAATRSALARYVEPFVAAEDFSGVIIMERGGEQLAAMAWGSANLDFGVPNTPDTKFCAESISKLFTRAAVLALASAGKLSLSDPLARFIPAFPLAERITIRELIEHKAGISRDLSLGAASIEPHSPAELAEMIAHTINAPPGRETSYSNNGYRLLARVVELAGKAPFDDLVRELVLQPRNMRDTVFGGFNEVMSRRATGYIPGPGWGTLVASPPWNYANSRGAASYFTTPNDLLRFVRTLPLEASDARDLLARNAARPEDRKFGHDGFGNGFADFAYAYPDDDARLVMMGNAQSGLFNRMHADLHRILLGQPVDPPRIDRPRPLPPNARWAQFVGQYALRPGAPLIIRRTGEHLEVSAGEDFHPLIATGPDRFFMRLRYATLSFPPAPETVNVLHWAEGGGTFDLKKLA